MDSETRAKIEALKAKNPKLAQALEEAYRAMKERQEREARDEKSVQDEENPPHQKAATPPAPPPADDPAPLPPQGPAEAPREAEPVQKLTTWREVREFEWRDYLSKAEALLAKWGHLERLGPLAPLVRLLVALAIREGARLDPSREAHVFLAQWEVAEMLGVSERTVERWLNDPRYERYRKVARWWIAWETWYTSGQGIGQEQAVKGGTLWRVRVRPLVRPGRPMKVLAPYLALPWRDLGEDAREGRTRRGVSAPDSMSGYKEGLLLGNGVTLRSVVGKPLATWESKKTPLLYPDTARDIRELLRAASIPGGRNGRQKWAQAVASAIAQALGDQKSLRWWLKVAWAALKALTFGGGEGPMRVLLRVVLMAQEARRDGFARSPGAYAQALLRREGWFDLVRPYEGFKVGVAV
jgi:hypothetical protein